MSKVHPSGINAPPQATKLAYLGNQVRSSTPDTVIGGTANAGGPAEHNPSTGFEQRAYWHFDTPWRPGGREKLFLPYALRNALTATITLMTVDWTPATLTWNNQPAATGLSRIISLATGSSNALPGLGRDRHEVPLATGCAYLRWAPSSGIFYGLRIAVSADGVDIATAEMIGPGTYVSPFVAR